MLSSLGALLSRFFYQNQKNKFSFENLREKVVHIENSQEWIKRSPLTYTSQKRISGIVVANLLILKKKVHTFFSKRKKFTELFFPPQKNEKFFKVKLRQIFSDGTSEFFAGIQIQKASPNWFRKFSEKNFEILECDEIPLSPFPDFGKFPPIGKISIIVN